jgi:hypothetical protein
MIIARALVGLLVGVLAAIVAVSVYYILQFKTRMSSVFVTVGARARTGECGFFV